MYLVLPHLSWAQIPSVTHPPGLEGLDDGLGSGDPLSAPQQETVPAWALAWAKALGLNIPESSWVNERIALP